jgi:hypothetical protein
MPHNCKPTGVQKTVDRYSSVHWAVKQMLVKDLRLFGLLTVDSVKYGNFLSDETIHSFEPTTLGVHIFELALTQPAKGESAVS